MFTKKPIALSLAGSILMLLSGCGTTSLGQVLPQKNQPGGTAGSQVQNVTGSLPPVVGATPSAPGSTSQTGGSAQASSQVSPPSSSTVQPLGSAGGSDQYPAMKIPLHTAVGSSFDWTAPSDGPYPVINKGDAIWIDASLSDQRVRIMKGNQAIYTMITSSGMDGADTETPTGTYTIEPERDTWFYNAGEQEGAKYWVSWKDHGIFLFHSVAMDQNQKVIPSEAAKLGTKASHGCFRLTISDAKWIFDNIQTGTKVVVHN